MSIGNRIKEARKLRRFSQKELGDRSGLSQSTLSELETGESQGTTYLARIAAALIVNPLWLETGKGPRDAGGELGPAASSANSLNMQAETARELQLLLVYRSADEREREALDDLIDELRIRIEARSRNQSKLTG